LYFTVVNSQEYHTGGQLFPGITHTVSPLSRQAGHLLPGTGFLIIPPVLGISSSPIFGICPILDIYINPATTTPIKIRPPVKTGIEGTEDGIGKANKPIPRGK